jgi:hypothetical protein
MQDFTPVSIQIMVFNKARRKPIQKALFRAYTIVFEHFESVFNPPEAD